MYISPHHLLRFSFQTRVFFLITLFEYIYLRRKYVSAVRKLNRWPETLGFSSVSGRKASFFPSTHFSFISLFFLPSFLLRLPSGVRTEVFFVFIRIAWTETQPICASVSYIKLARKSLFFNTPCTRNIKNVSTEWVNQFRNFKINLSNA